MMTRDKLQLLCHILRLKSRSFRLDTRHECRRVPVPHTRLLRFIHQLSNLLQILFRELINKPRRREVLVDVLDLLRPRDGNRALSNEPGDGDLRGGSLVRGADLLEALHEAQDGGEVLRAELGDAFAEVCLVEIVWGGLIAESLVF